MSLTIYSGDAVVLKHSRPLTVQGGDAVALTLLDAAVGDVVGALSFSAAAGVVHGVVGDGVVGDGVVSLPFSASADGEYLELGAAGNGLVVLPFSALADGSHGVAGDAVAGFLFSAAAGAVHGVAGDALAAFSFSATSGAVHGVVGAADGNLSFSAGAGGIVERYEVAGEVRQGVVLLERHVRVYNRLTGELVGSGFSTGGRFRIHTGFAADEHYIVPIDLSELAGDYTPPAINRVVAVLAEDVR